MAYVSSDYLSFINDKVLEYLPVDKVKVGDKWNFRCPICHDSKKSMTKRRGWWYCRTASYYCFNCGTGLSGIRFLETVSGTNYDDIKREYLKLFAGTNGKKYENLQIDPQKIDLLDLKPLVKPEWKMPLSPSAIKYLDSRLVTRAPFFTGNLYSWFSKKNEEYILIPWTINGVDAYYQLNDFQKYHSMKYLFPKSEKKLVAGLDQVDVSWPYIIVFEGYYDSLFVKNGVCSGTKAITDLQLELIHARYPRHQICISFDNDPSGLDSMMKLIRGSKKFKFFKWFDACTKQKDINDYVKARNDVNIFADKQANERLIVDSLVMKLWMIRNGKWKND